jgi:hypothetical protein
MLTACLIACVLSQNSTLTLFRGAEIPGSDTKYWSAEDITLDSQKPDMADAGGFLMNLNPKTRVLLRFGDLRRAVGPSRRIVAAKLVLQGQVHEAGALTVSKFDADWNDAATVGSAQPAIPQWSTSWNYQFFDESGKSRKWRSGGSQFVSRTPSATVQAAKDSRKVEIEGLAADVQAFYDRPYDDHGWALEFTGSADFNANNGDTDGPQLVIETAAEPAKDGPDLSVVYITRTPEYERYDNRGEAYVRATVDGHESGVMMNPGDAQTKKWPDNGEEVTYTAYVKNVGSAPTPGFGYAWSQSYEAGPSGQNANALAPGETATFTFKTKFRMDKKDHRTQPISFRITPSGSDALAANDSLEIQANALNIGIWVDENLYKKFGEQVNGSGSKSFEDWIQWQFSIWNDVFLKESRFSFAPDGSRERMRVGRITIVPNGTLAGGAHLPKDTPSLIYDGEWGFDSSFGDFAGYIDAVRTKADRALIHEMSHQVGLIDMYQMNVDPANQDGTGGKVQLKVGGRVLTRGWIDRYAGLMGGGDTRNEILLPRQLPIPFGGAPNFVFESPIAFPTDLYALTDVAALNSNLGYRRGFFGEYLYSMPSVNMIRVTDRNGEEIDEGTLQFYQMVNGQIPDGPPTFELPFKNGSAVLPQRATGIASPFTTATGHTLAPNPFGRLDVVGTNGVFLVRLDYKGQTEWTWLKAWQLFDAYARGNKSVFVNALRFNVTSMPIKPLDWALKKTAVDEANSTGANLANLLDGDPKTFYESGAGNWVEIDIGRDRPIGEIKLIMTGDPNAFWKKFDILLYSTGQTVASAQLYASEADWRGAVAQHRDFDDAGVLSVAYRGKPKTARFVRIVNKSGEPGKLAGIEIRETEVAP